MAGNTALGLILIIYHVTQLGVLSWVPTLNLGQIHPRSSSWQWKASQLEISGDGMDIHDAFQRGERTSLAGDYTIVINDDDEKSWSIFSIDEVVSDQDIFTSGARSVEALVTSRTKPNANPLASLKHVWTGDMKVAIGLDLREKTVSIDMELLDLLQRIYAQWLLSSNDATHSGTTSSFEISFFQESNGALRVDTSDGDFVETLFKGLFEDPKSMEWVEMVTGTGEVLGQLPRKLVHAFNILHRGIGLFVTKDRPIDLSKKEFPDLYVHRRASTKRIFPSLYDMFVGGVSLAGEPAELTARREVAEELGLSGALDANKEMMGPLLDCTVCTAYNRCVVTFFSYCMDYASEMVTWQEEEVDWGQFVPYPVIVAAADRSIQRFAAKKEWPGMNPPIQSERNGSLGEDVQYPDDDWKEWDFVPDGLLVWEAWLHHLRSKST